MRVFILCIFALFTTAANAAITPLQYGNYIYEGDIRTVQCYQALSGYNLPAAALGSAESLTLEFDKLSSEQEYFQYTLIHCDYLWNPTSNLTTNQFLSGMGYQDIPDPIFSNSVLTQYTHYRFDFPTQDVMPKISGNYLLVVYRNYDQTDVVITRRVMIYDNQGLLELEVKQSPMVETRRTHQQLLFNFQNNPNYLIPRPYEQLFVVAMQNADWNTAVYNLKPQFISGNKFIYNQNTGNIWPGINEFRFFDMRSLIGAAANVKDRYNVNGQRHIELVREQSRKYDTYLRWSDYNGRYLIYNRDLPSLGSNKTGSDYVFVHFSLKADEAKDRKVFIYGELSDWRIQNNFRCYYNAEKGEYEAIVQLKQAYYNYMFVVQNEDGTLDFSEFESNQSQTENNYNLLVYHQNQGLGYHELIGYGMASSQPER